MSGRKIVVGLAPELDWAVTAWRDADPSLELIPVPLGQREDDAFDLTALDAIDWGDATAFVACDARFLNLRRYELMSVLKARGVAMPALVARSAVVAPDARLGENCFIGDRVLIGCGTRVGYNTVLGAGAQIGRGVEIGHSCWVGATAVVDDLARLANCVTLGTRVMVAREITIGESSVVDPARDIVADLAAKTFLLAGFDTPVTIFN